MIDKEEIKKWVKQDAVIKDVCNRIPHRDEAFGFTYYDINEKGAERVELAIDQAIDLAIDFTLQELDKEMETLKRIENALQEINMRLAKLEKASKKQPNVTPYDYKPYDKPTLITKKKFKWW